MIVVSLDFYSNVCSNIRLCAFVQIDFYNVILISIIFLVRTDKLHVARETVLL